MQQWKIEQSVYVFLQRVHICEHIYNVVSDAGIIVRCINFLEL